VVEILGGSVSEEAAALRSLVGSLVPRPSLRASPPPACSHTLEPRYEAS